MHLLQKELLAKKQFNKIPDGNVDRCIREKPQDQRDLSIITYKEQTQQHQSHQNNQQNFLKK